MTDPMARAAFSISSSLLRYLVSERIMTKEQVVRFMTEMVDGAKKTGDKEAATILEFVQTTLSRMSEPKNN